MEYLLDTANLKSIAYYVKKLPVTGVTSNPSIVKKEGKVDFFAHMKEIRRIIGPDRTLHIQVTSDTVEGMMADARAILAKVDEKVFIKVPVTLDGLEVIKAAFTPCSRGFSAWRQVPILSLPIITAWKIRTSTRWPLSAAWPI